MKTFLLLCALILLTLGLCVGLTILVAWIEHLRRRHQFRKRARRQWEIMEAQWREEDLVLQRLRNRDGI